MALDVAHDQADTPPGQPDGVVEVAAHPPAGPRGQVAHGHVQFGEVRGLRGQHALLDGVGQFQLRALAVDALQRLSGQSGQGQHEGALVRGGVVGLRPGHHPHPQGHLGVPEDRDEGPGVAPGLLERLPHGGEPLQEFGAALEEARLPVVEDGPGGMGGVPVVPGVQPPPGGLLGRGVDV